MVEALPRFCGSRLVLGTETVLATATSAATAEILERGAEDGPEEGLLVNAGGLARRAAGERALGRRRSPGSGGPRASLCAALGAVRGRACLPEIL